MHINISHSIRTRCQSAYINERRSAQGRSSAKGMSFPITRPSICGVESQMCMWRPEWVVTEKAPQNNDLFMPHGSTSCLLIRKAISLASTNYLVLGTGPLIRRLIGPTSRRFFGSCLYDSLYSLCGQALEHQTRMPSFVDLPSF